MAMHDEHDEMDAKFSRRSFLGGAAAGVAAGALGGASKAYAQGSAVAELRTDVVVCGSGMGGLTAAMRVQKEGGRVIVLEKAYEPGGTTAHSEGAVVNPAYENIRNNAPYGDPVVQRAISENIPRFYEFVDKIGAPVRVRRVGDPPRPGQTAPPAGGGRGAAPALPVGTYTGGSIPPVAWVNWMVAELERGKNQVLVETPMLRLLVNRLHEVIGVLAEGPKGPVRIFAKAVVLATGGWPGNAQLVTAHITRNFGGMHQRNAGFGGRKPPLTGDGLLAAMHIGGAPSTGGWDGFYGHMLPARPTKKFANPLADYSLYHGNSSIAVNLYGRRFADESQGKQAFPMRGGGEQLINQEAARQPEACAAYIWDEPINTKRACADCGLGDLDKYPAYRDIGAPTAKADTLLDLVQQMEKWNRGLSAEVLYQEIIEYNQAAKNGKTWALRIPKQAAVLATPIETPPFYSIMAQSGITSTHGGIRINENGQVLSRGERPIKGLYAAGTDIGNFNNYVYIGNLCIGASSGYLSGGNAAKESAPRGGWEISPFV